MTVEPSVAAFQGRLSCQRDTPPLNLTLTGYTREHPDELTSVVFAQSSLEQLPPVLEQASVEQLGPGRFRVQGNAREWVFTAAGCHVHRDVSARFYRAIPPRIAPWSKRLLWRVMLGLADHPLGIRLLRGMRR